MLSKKHKKNIKTSATALQRREYLAKKKKKELKGYFNTDACVIDVASNLDTVVSHLLLKRLVYTTES